MHSTSNGKCSAPCVKKISQKNYLEEVDAAIKFIEGKDKSFLEHSLFQNG